MKREKINDRQIRCVLTKEELEDRKIRLSEIVCGGEKARSLFRDMMLRASRELGFCFNNNPLMIEAVPTGKDQLVLIITRVDDPGELDSRFHHLSGFQSSEKEPDAQTPPALSGADDVLKLLRRFARQLEEKKTSPGRNGNELKTAAREDGKTAGGETRADEGKERADLKGVNAGKSAGDSKETNTGRQAGDAKGTITDKDAAGQERKAEKEFYQYTRFYLFRSLENVLAASKRVPEDYRGENTLYKNPDDGAYYLLVKKMDTDPEQFNRICNVLSEYSMPMDYSSGMDEFFREHMQVIVAGRAMQNLRRV